MVVSPVSATMAISLISQASDGITFDELQNGLHLSSLENVTIADKFNEYYVLLQKNAGQSELMVANRIYVQQDFPLKPSFQEVATVKLFSGSESVDFTKANVTADIINKFVGEKTNERIKEIVKSDRIDPNYRAILINAISFKGTWVQPFPVILKRNFYISETEFVERDFMFVSQRFWSYSMDKLDARAIRLDYANSNFSFVLIMSNNRTGFDALESQLLNYTLSQIMDQMTKFKCIIYMPKFKIESSFSLKEILKKVWVLCIY